LISTAVRKTVLSNAYLRIANYYIANKKSGQALKYLLYSLVRFPGHRSKEKIYLMLKEFPVTGWIMKK